MDDYKVLERKFYNEFLDGYSMFTDSEVCILGEQTVVTAEGKVIEQYLYNIKGYRCENGRPFISHKGNIVVIQGRGAEAPLLVCILQI